MHWPVLLSQVVVFRPVLVVTAIPRSRSGFLPCPVAAVVAVVAAVVPAAGLCNNWLPVFSSGWRQEVPLSVVVEVVPVAVAVSVFVSGSAAVAVVIVVGRAVAVAVVLMRLVTTSPAMGITSIQVKDATPTQIAAQAQADLKYPRLDQKP